MAARPLIALLLLGVLTQCAPLPPQNPIIGIYTQDSQDFGQQKGPQQTYIAASYVKNIQMTGAQVVPIFYHYSKEQLEDLLSKINGVFIPGGEMPIDRENQWTSNIQVMFDYANKQNDAGNPFPIWATCLGYEAALYLFANQKDNMTVLTRVEGQHGLTCPLSVKNSNSVLLKNLSPDQYNQVTTGDGLLWFHQTWAITVKTFQETESINKFWKLVSTSPTQGGVEQVSTVEAYNYPYFMTQYHPQKNSFEWRINPKRTYRAISVEQKMINEFTKVARLNSNRMSQQEWKQKWIYNYNPIYTPDSYYFPVVYLFDESHI